MSRRESWHRMITAPQTGWTCGGCRARFATYEEIEKHHRGCEPWQANRIPSDYDADGWMLASDRMKRAALEANAKGRTDEYDAYMRRSEACAVRAKAAAEKATVFDLGAKHEPEGK